MLNDIKRLFRQSIEAFREEISTREPEDQVAELLGAMRKELVAARAAIPEFEEEVTAAKAELARERGQLAKCERRGGQAERIGDAETARVAWEFAAKHRERATVLDQKIAAAEAELALHRREADEMRQRYQEADANRFALLAQLRRASARERMRSATSGEGSPLSDWERMEEKIEHGAAYADALDDLDGSAPPTEPGGVSVEERLRELKRKMGGNDG